MKKRILIAALTTLRALGAFHLARWLTRGQLRILCYHGASLADEHRFRGGLFMSPALFEARLEQIAAGGYPVLPLSDAVDRLGAGKLPAGATVITIDDGWTGTAIAMAPALEQRGFPATLYVASYYMDRQTQVYNVAIDYVLWSTDARELDLAAVDPSLEGRFLLADTRQRNEACDRICAWADTLADASARQAAFERVCAAVAIDVGDLKDRRLFTFMSRAEATALGAAGIDLQLHTHRHRLPADDQQAAVQEITENRERLRDLTSGDLVHFCYPSGEYEPHQLSWLEDLGIASATTCDAGFNYQDTDRLQLRRFLDSERVTAIEFEAEMSGVFELIRRCGYAI